MLHMPGTFRTRSSLKGQTKLESFLGGSLKILMSRFDKTLLMRLKEVPTKDKKRHQSMVIRT
jgi:hypothetical protein